MSESPSTGERLGYGPEDRLVILNCDDLGLSHSTNVGVYDAMRRGIATSASLMVPCPWSRQAAFDYRGEDVGVHLTLNAEWERYRWGPVTRSPSLLDGDGGFPRTIEDLWEHADLDEVRRECHAQIERAILWGFDVTHLDSHMGALQLGFPFRSLAADEGVVFPDHFVYVNGVGSRRAIERVLFELRPGVTEIYVHPATDSAELRAITADWPARVDDHAFVTDDVALQAMFDRAGVIRIGWHPLRDLMRAGA